MKKSLTTSLICLTGLLFTPTASYAQCDPPEIPYEQDNEYEAVALYVENSECGDGAPFASNFASTFLNILKENGYMGKYIPNISVDYWDFTDSTIWEDGRDHINPSEDTDDFGTDWADAVFFVTHGMPDEVGNGASYFLMGADNGTEDEYGGDTCYIATRGRHTSLWPFAENPWRPNSREESISSQNSINFNNWLDYVSVFFGKLFFFFFPHPGHIGWGDVDANATATVSCHSSEQKIWENHGYKPGEFSKKQFNIYAGIHGPFYPQFGGAEEHFEDFMHNSINQGIGQTWVEDMTFLWNAFPYLPEDTQCCGTAVTFGSTFEQRENFFLNAGWKNFLYTGRRGSGSTFWGIEGCKPHDTYNAGIIHCPSESNSNSQEIDSNNIEDSNKDTDTEKPMVRLEPEELNKFESRVTGEFKVQDMLSVIKQITDSTDFVVLQNDSKIFNAENGSYLLQLNPDEFSFNIRAKGNLHGTIVENDIFDDDFLRKTAYRTMEALGAEQDEIRLDSENIIALNRNSASDDIECFRYTKGYQINRVIGGIKVVDNYVMITFLMDGSLLSIRGKWTPINYLHSQLYSDLKYGQMAEKAFAKLETENVDLYSSPEISLGTVYRAVHDVECGWVLKLMGTVMVVYKNTEGEIIDGRMYEFDI